MKKFLMSALGLSMLGVAAFGATSIVTSEPAQAQASFSVRIGDDRGYYRDRGYRRGYYRGHRHGYYRHHRPYRYVGYRDRDRYCYWRHGTRVCYWR